MTCCQVFATRESWFRLLWSPNQTKITLRSFQGIDASRAPKPLDSANYLARFVSFQMP